MENVVLIPVPLAEFEKRISAIIDGKLKESQPAGSEFLSIKQACAEYDVTKVTLYNWRRQGLIRIFNLSGKAFVSRVELDGSIKRSSILGQ